jgi:hypothetical protein
VNVYESDTYVSQIHSVSLAKGYSVYRSGSKRVSDTDYLNAN